MTTNKTRICKRILSVVLAAILIFSLMPISTISVFAAGSVNVKITVIDENEAPVEDAEVYVGDEKEKPTDSDGVCEIKGMTEGVEYEITVNKFGYEEEIIEYKVESPYEKTIALTPLPTVTVSGIVVDEEGNPLENAVVKISGYTEDSAYSSETGEFVFSNIYDEKDYTLSVSLDGYKSVTQAADLSDTNEITLYAKESEELEFEQDYLEVEYGSTGVNTATSSLGDADAYESEDESIATVDDSGVVTPVSIGTTTIKAVRYETEDALESEASYTVEIVKGTQEELVWVKTPPESLTLIESFGTKAEGGTGSGAITYSSSNRKVAKVSSKGNLTLVSAGEVTITAKKDGGEFYNDETLSYTLMVCKAPQSPLAFEEAHPDAIYYNDTYTNVATGGSVTENSVEYSSSDEKTATVNSDGTIKALKSGKVEITATLKGNNTYEDVSASYSIVIYRADQVKEFKFVKGGGTHTIVYGEEFENAAEGGENSPISYKSSNERVATVDSNGKITALKSGKVTITATNPQDDRFNEKVISYKLVINRADQTVEFENGNIDIPSIVYGDTYTNAATAQTSVSYTSSDESIATVNSKGKITTIKAGKVTITATAEETDQYNGSVNSYDISIKKATQNILFEKGTYDTEKNKTIDEIQFNDNDNRYQNKAVSAQQGSSIVPSYRIVSGSDNISDFNEQTGEFSIVKVGTVVIRASVTADDKYRGATSSYTLKINKSDQTIAFPQSEYELICGHDFTPEETPKASSVGKLFGDGEITYSYKDDSNSVIKSMTADGTINLSYKPGTVTVVAEKASDSNYNSAVAEYNLTVKPWKLSDDVVYYTLEGDKTSPENEWFVGNVSLKAAENYSVSFDGSKDKADWQASFADVVTSDGADNSVSFYVKNSNGDISEKITEVIKKDTVSPQAEIQTSAPSVIEKLLTIISFGIWKKDTVEYTAESGDALSGVAMVEYYVDKTNTDVMDKESLDAVTEWQTYENSISVDKDSAYVAYVKVTDTAGNYIYTSTSGVIFDATAAEITLTPSGDNSFADGYYTGDVDFAIDVKDPQPSSGLSKVDYSITVNDTVIQEGNLFTYVSEDEETLVSEWKKDSLVVPSSNLLETDAVKLTVTSSDLSGNESKKEYDLRVFSAPAEVTVSEIAEGYYQGSVKSLITVSGRPDSFSPDNVTVYVDSKDAKGSDVDSNYVLGEWIRKDDNYVSEIEFKGDANYSDFYVRYKDKGEHGLEGFSEKYSFTVDNNLPEGLVSIAENGWDTFLNVITFGLWSKDSVDVDITADDITSPIEKIEYFTTDEKATVSLDDLKNYTDWKPFEKYSVADDEAFVVYSRITDAAGNESYLSSNGFIVDTHGSAITITPEEANKNGYYNSDVNVDIFVADAEPHSGIKSVDYWVVTDGVTTKEENLFTFDVADPGYDELVSEKDFSVTVEAESNNSDNVELFVKVEDNAGNTTQESVKLKIDKTAPKIEISFDNNSGNVYDIDGEERGYFDGNRIATISITERSSSFNEKNAEDGIVIKGYVKGQEKTIDRTMIDGWTLVEGAVPDEDVHIAKVTFADSYDYNFGVSYTDEAGNTNTSVETGKSLTPFVFTVDKNDPTASVTVKDNTWNTLLEVLTFGLWSNESVSVSAEADDETSPFVIEKYVTDRTTQMTKDELDKLKESKWEPFSNYDVTADKQFVVYLKVTDYAGNYIYINSDGFIVDMTTPTLKLTPDATSITHNDIGVYNDDVNVKVSVNDPAPYSGIKTIDYWVKCNGEVTEDGRIYEFDVEKPTQEQLENRITKTITVHSELNNSCNVSVYVKVTDNAGNVVEDTVPLDIDVTAPTIDISYDNNSPYKTVDDRGFFPAARKAKVVITERTDHFNEDNATNGIKIEAVNASGKKVIADTKTLIGAWNTDRSSESPEKDTHTAYIDYSADANYTFKISYKDLAGNTNDDVNTGASAAPYQFTVDKLGPTGKVSVDGLGVWDELVNTLTFGLWSRVTVHVSGTSDDVTSPIESVSYYKVADTTALSYTALTKVTDWKPFNGFDVKANERFTVYMRIVDYAGNTTYISTNGVIVDDVAPVVESVSPEITVTPQQPVNGIYNTDVDVAVKVYDPANGGTYSGLKNIRYEIYNMGEKTQSGTLYNFTMASPKQNQLLQKWEDANAIVVSKELNNSNDVEIKVFATDNAGNSNQASANIKIDITNPTISVSYDNDDGDTSFADSTTDAFFKADRTATIVITERNFDPDQVKLTITNTDGVIPTLSGWSTVEGSGNGDGTTHTATVTFSSDGDYTFDISCVDLAGNANSDVSYTGVATQKFTIDKTAPVFSVTYDNNDYKNGNYFKADRTATLTVTEHNFETTRVKISITATDDGASVTAPSSSGWTSSGDTNTTTITYSTDAHFTFDFEYSDKAGNSISEFTQQDFYVDKTMPELAISKIVDESANNNEGNIGYVVTASDTNFDEFTPVLTAVVRNGNDFETKTLDVGKTSDIKNGKVYTVDNLETDGIYRVTCTVVDKAGNAFDKVTLSKADGSTYVEKRSGDDTLVTFSVNRLGSTFELDANTLDLLDKYYVQRVENDIVVVEINTDPLTDYSVTLNEAELDKDKYKVDKEGGNGKWMKYTYTLEKSLFEDEGEYNIVVSSKDKAKNDAFSDVKNASIKFVVDRTAPIVTVTGLENNGRYQTDSQIVTVVPTDDGGALKSIEVTLVDNDGKVLDELLNLSGEKFLSALEEGNGKVTFSIAEGLYQNVRIVCDDEAYYGDEENVIFDELFTNVSVTSSGFLIFWANKPLRYGSIAGVLALAIGATAFIVSRKRKKNNPSKKKEAEKSN